MLGLEMDISLILEEQVSVDLNVLISDVFSLGLVKVVDHVPSTNDFNVLTITWKSIIWPVAGVTPESEESFIGFSQNNIFIAVCVASDTLQLEVLDIGWVSLVLSV